MMNIQTLTLDEAIANRLQEHPMPYPVTLVKSCKIAIERANNFDLFSKIELPAKVHFRNVYTWELEQEIEVFKYIELFHLHIFLTKEALEKHNAWMAS